MKILIYFQFKSMILLNTNYQSLFWHYISVAKDASWNIWPTFVFKLIIFLSTSYSCKNEFNYWRKDIYAWANRISNWSKINLICRRLFDFEKNIDDITYNYFEYQSKYLAVSISLKLFSNIFSRHIFKLIIRFVIFHMIE